MENYQEHIEDYWDGNLHGEDLEAFVHEMDANKEFRDQVMLHQEIRESLRNDLVHDRQQKALNETTHELNSKYFRPKMTKPGSGFNLKAFVAFLIISILVATLVYFLLPTSSNLEQAFNMPVASLTLKGTNDGELNTKAETAFNNGSYKEAIIFLEELRSEHPMDVEIQFFAALSHLETGGSQKAIELLKSLSAGNSALKYDAQWYLVLAFHKAGKAKEVESALMAIPTDSPYFEKASELLENL
jgi:tetratricopeptide (TPR) repeat protein